MIDITLTNGFVTFENVASNVESCEIVDEYSYHLGTSSGVYLININDSTINQISFTTSSEAVTYILNN